jgi:hypothetical protein
MSGMKTLLLDAVESIDAVLGDGYAKKNPDLISGLINSEIMSFGFFQLSDAISFLAGINDDFGQPN